MTGLVKRSQPHPPLSRSRTCQMLSQAALCSLPVPALRGRDGRASSRVPAVCQVVKYEAWDPAWVYSPLSVDRPVSLLCQAHRCIPSREAAPWYPAPGYLNRTPPSDHCSMFQLWSSWGYKQAAFTAGGSSQPRGGHFHSITSIRYQLSFGGE